MIGVDTNLLARLFVDDDPRQQEIAGAFFGQRSTDDPAYVSLVVIAEFVWLLGKTYDYSKKSVTEALAALLESPDFIVESRNLVEDALVLSEQPKVGIVDVLISRIAMRDGCVAVATFDKEAAKRVPGMKLLA